MMITYCVWCDVTGPEIGEGEIHLNKVAKGHFKRYEWCTENIRYDQAFFAAKQWSVRLERSGLGEAESNTDYVKPIFFDCGLTAWMLTDLLSTAKVQKNFLVAVYILQGYLCFMLLILVRLPLGIDNVLWYENENKKVLGRWDELLKSLPFPTLWI